MPMLLATSHPAGPSNSDIPGEYSPIVGDQPVAVRDLAAELGMHYTALHHHVRSGKVPTHRVRNMLFVSANIAQQVREWHKDNRNRTWPYFTEDPPDAGEPAPSP